MYRINQNKNKIKLFFLSLFAIGIFLSSVGPALAQTAASAQAQTSAQTPQQRCDALQQNLNITGNSNIAPSNLVTGAGLVNWCTPGQVLVTVFNLLSAFAGIVTVVFIVIGGYFYLSSAGNEEQAEKGRKILTNAIIGLVIIILAVAIVRIIGATLSSSTTTAGTSATGQSSSNPSLTTTGSSNPNSGNTAGGNTAGQNPQAVISNLDGNKAFNIILPSGQPGTVVVAMTSTDFQTLSAVCANPYVSVTWGSQNQQVNFSGSGPTPQAVVNFTTSGSAVTASNLQISVCSFPITGTVNNANSFGN